MLSHSRTDAVLVRDAVRIERNSVEKDAVVAGDRDWGCWTGRGIAAAVVVVAVGGCEAEEVLETSRREDDIGPVEVDRSFLRSEDRHDLAEVDPVTAVAAERAVDQDSYTTGDLDSFAVASQVVREAGGRESEEGRWNEMPGVLRIAREADPASLSSTDGCTNRQYRSIRGGEGILHRRRCRP